jgi:hypothetical protein
MRRTARHCPMKSPLMARRPAPFPASRVCSARSSPRRALPWVWWPAANRCDDGLLAARPFEACAVSVPSPWRSRSGGVGTRRCRVSDGIKRGPVGPPLGVRRSALRQPNGRPDGADAGGNAHVTISERSSATTAAASPSQPEEPALHEPIPCPQRGAPAWITEQFSFGSTAGPVEHLKTGCVNSRWPTPLAEMVQQRRPAAPARDAKAVRA